MSQASLNWYYKNKARAKDYSKRYYERNKERILSRCRKYYNRNQPKYEELRKRWHKRHPEKRRLYRQRQRQRYHNDPVFKIVHNARRRLARAVHSQSTKKAGSTFELIGCSPQELRTHLESQFTAEMSWANYGYYWHVDHIREIRTFDLTDPQRQRECFHYTNLRPLKWLENLKRNRNFTLERSLSA